MPSLIESTKTRSVLQGWVMELPLREQGTLLASVRGCDMAPKYDPNGDVIDTPERRLTRWMRWAFMVPADPREVDYPGAFMCSISPFPFKASAFGHYPLHWVSHLVHAAEVIAYRNPDPRVAETALAIYHAFVHMLHLFPETREQFDQRLSEDRIATGTVVS